MWQRQPDAVLNLNNPVSGALNPVLAATDDVRIISIEAHVNFTVQPSPLEVHETVDGNVITYQMINPVTATSYGARIGENADETLQVLDPANAYASYRAFLDEGQNIGVTAEITGGTVQLLYCRVKWARLLPT
jgi:hypothetical protein